MLAQDQLSTQQVCACGPSGANDLILAIPYVCVCVSALSQDNLKSVRRDLTIMTGAILPPEPPAPPPGKAGANDKAMRDLSDSRLVRKYFQIGNEEEEENNNGVAMVTDLVIDPADLWTQVR